MHYMSENNVQINEIIKHNIYISQPKHWLEHHLEKLAILVIAIYLIKDVSTFLYNVSVETALTAANLSHYI